MTKLDGAAVAITGAASGIGRALASALADKHCRLALADRDAAGLDSIAAEIRGRTASTVTLHAVDVSKAGEIARFAADATAAHPTLSVLVNNAGVAMLGDHDQVDIGDFQWLMDINFWGVVNGCRAFLPHLARQPAAHIVNVSSVFGLIAPAGQTCYSASKFAVRGYSEALRHELEERGGTIKVATVHPGGIKTNIVRNARAVPSLSNRRRQLENGFEKMARTTPAEAARRIIVGIERNEPRILIGSDARLIDKLQRLMPVRYHGVLKRLAERTSGSRVRPTARTTT